MKKPKNMVESLIHRAFDDGYAEFSPSLSDATGTQLVVRDNRAMEFPLVHVFAHERHEHPVFTSTQHRIRYMHVPPQAVSPKSCMPGYYKFDTTIHCPVCGTNIPITVKQRTRLLISRSELGLRAKRYSFLNLGIAYFRRSLFTFLFASIVFSFIPGVLTLRLLTPPEVPVTSSPSLFLLWLLFALLFVFARFLYGVLRLWTCGQVCLSIRDSNDPGYGDSRSFNSIDSVWMTPQKNGPHVTEVSTVPILGVNRTTNFGPGTWTPAM